MKIKTLIILILLQLILLLFLSQTINYQIQEGTIKTIKYSNNKISIGLENQSINLIIFTNKILQIKKGDEIKFSGKEEVYQNKTQIIIHKLECLSQ